MEEIPEVCRNEVMEWDPLVRQLGGLLMGLLSEGLGLSPGKLPELTCLETRAMVGNYYPLQVKHGNEWVDVTLVPGALTISNDEYKSMDHRVLVNPNQEPCVSVAVFCDPSNRKNEFRPFLELISLDKPAAFQQFNLNKYMRRFFTKELEGKSLINYFRA
ncbi:1-aminocyclopropane-1-carboxylate oxidase homolog 12-like [Eucalyptus grandis]|uniref:1-aminocyclopropane-1-carboxylate oxidase homolog 12-like n=1 Tax=Eucalyptus grandis TaxID=71139 RepID=UPI00192F0689|nr:1-aminocyclopropane-1-carboxylate oxidase homolog 12-like [Eucalyptus grandis]